MANLPPDQATENRAGLAALSSQAAGPCVIVGPSTQPTDWKPPEAQGFQCFCSPARRAAQLDDLAKQTVLPGHLRRTCLNSSQLKQWTEIVGIADGIPKALEQFL